MRPNFLESNNNEPFSKRKEAENDKIAKNYQDCEILQNYIRGHSFGERALDKNEVFLSKKIKNNENYKNIIKDSQRYCNS